MTLDEFMQTLVKPNPEAKDTYDYEALAFDAGVEYTVNKIRGFLESETKEQVTLTEYLSILSALSDNRKDVDFNDEDVSWEEFGYQTALNDIKNYLENDEESINDTLQQYKEIED